MGQVAATCVPKMPGVLQNVRRSLFTTDLLAFSRPGRTRSPGVKTEGLLGDPKAMPPDEIVAAKDAIPRLQQDLRNWPRPDREVFERYFVEGLEPEKIAMVTRQPLKIVRKTISSIQDRLREEMLAQEVTG
ncbi:MAG: hypothetical protein QOC70_1878 [Verrucomicrobiota bacterium]